MDIPVFSRVKVQADEEFVGLYLPKEGEYIVLKLDSGYNVGIHPDSIKHIDILEKAHPPKEVQVEQVKQDKDLAKVHIIHTGGTIASKVDYETGGVVSKFKPEELIAMFPELTKIAQIEAEFIGNMSSDDFRFAHFNKVAKAVHKAAQEGINRIIVTSGTDFLHYMATALAFILKDVSVGVLVVGAQRSSDRGSSDAAINLQCATQFLAKSNFKGVAVCMHDGSNDDSCAILPGVNVRKMHSSMRRAFKAINKNTIARVEFPSLKMHLNTTIEVSGGDVPEKIPLLNEKLKIGIVYSHPQMHHEELSVYEKFDGLVLAGSGLGHFPITESEDTKEHKKIFTELKKLAEKIPVVMSAQTVYGRINMNVYSPGRQLKGVGVLGHQSMMTTETAFIKLAFLLSNHKKQVSEMFMKNMVGEQEVTDAREFL